VDPANPGYQVLFSPDGTTWSAQDLSTFTGVTSPGEGIDNTSVTASQVLITIQRPGSTAEVTVIGTPG
jgi:hypothetical protein